ncbi:MAG: hypothetical protein EB047_01745 [Chitinophagaceae bacterium]|nr:hypothetical protein [Chitinophagaceae bacterium]
MSLNQVKLPPELLAQLYHTVLVELPGSTSIKNQPTEQSTTDKIKSLGGHKKKICIVVAEQEAVFLKDEQLAYLTRILMACKLTLEDVALINIQEVVHPNYQHLQQQYPSTTCIVFGLTPQNLQLPVDFPFFQLQKIEGCTYLFAPALDLLEPQKADREKLWQSLRKQFNV